MVAIPGSLEGLRTQGFPVELITTRRYEIPQRTKLRQELAVVHAAEVYVTEPPTVESLRFTTRQLQRHRPTVIKQPYNPRYAMRSRHHPFIPGKMVHPVPGLPQAAQNIKPRGSRNGSPLMKQAPQPMSRSRIAPGAYFISGQPGHFARECLTREQARKPVAPIAAADEQINMCEAMDSRSSRLYWPIVLCKLWNDQRCSLSMPKRINTGQHCLQPITTNNF